MTTTDNLPTSTFCSASKRIKQTLQEIREFVAVDRVLLYQFLDDGSGQVIAESLNPSGGLCSLHNLRFPNCDIPQAARERLLQQQVRIFIDAGLGQQFEQFPHNQQKVRYDTPSQCHLTYLRQLNIATSLTYPIVINGKLWGLLLIHHRHRQRWQKYQLTMVELLSERLTLLITTEELSQSQQNFLHREQTIKIIRELLQTEATGDNAIKTVLETIVNRLNGSSGRLYWQHQSGDTQVGEVGPQPVSEPSTVLEETPFWQQALQSGEESDISSYGGSALAWDCWLEETRYSALVIPLGSLQHQQGYLTIFRPNPLQAIWWAGPPPNEDTEMPSLRSSFEPYPQWHQPSPLQCWTLQEIQLACAIAQLLGDIDSICSWGDQQRTYLTGLPDRKQLTQQLASLQLEAKTKEIYAVVFLDLDRFQQVNNTLGHSAGDKLLQLVAQRLESHLSENFYLLGHWSSDQFVIVFRHLNQLDSGAIEQQVARIGNCFETPFSINHQTVYVKASWGVAIAPYDGRDPESLLLNAETAMYTAKQQGGNGYQVYTPALQSPLNPLTLETELRQALQTNELKLVYQPQVALATGEVTAVEALLRWPHPDRGFLPPYQFIPLAEQTNLICELGNWVLHTACQQLAQWRNQGLDQLRMAVNISARHFQQTDFVDTIKQVLAENHLPGSALEIEITETIAAENVELTQWVLRQLQDLGVSVALDDFGMGYSSLHAIKQFPLDTLKIDRAFLTDLPNSEVDTAIVTSIITLAQGLSLRVVAEGIETFQQFDALQSLPSVFESQGPYQEIQGYFFSEPLPAAEVEPFLWTSHSEQLDSVPTPSNASGDATDSSRSQQTTSPLQQLFHQTRRERVVAQIAQQVHASLDLEEIFQLTVDQIRDFLKTDRVLLYRFESDWRGTVVTESVDASWQSLLNKEIEDPCFETKCAPLYTNGRVLNIPDIEERKMTPCYRNMLRSFQVRANLVIPILHQQDLWGLLIAHHCRSSREWYPSEVTLLEQLTTQVGVAIHQAELYRQLQQANEKLEELAIKDGLTKIANRRLFDDTLDQQWQRLQREQKPLSLILCDIDDFKLYNDYYGHQAGDDCLVQIANVLQELVYRPDDLVARYGGEEFAIILPNTTADQALVVAERVQQAVRALNLKHGNSSVAPYVTLSLGVASVIPSASSSRKILIRQADEALYQAKAQGRDRAINYQGKA